MHLAISAEERSIGVDDGRGVSVNARGLSLEDRHHQHHLQLSRQLSHPLYGRSGNWLGEIEALVLLRLAEVGRVEKLLQADNLGALFGCLADVGLRARDVLFYVVADRFLDNSDGERG